MNNTVLRVQSQLLRISQNIGQEIEQTRLNGKNHSQLKSENIQKSPYKMHCSLKASQNAQDFAHVLIECKNSKQDQFAPIQDKLITSLIATSYEKAPQVQGKLSSTLCDSKLNLPELKSIERLEKIFNSDNGVDNIAQTANTERTYSITAYLLYLMSLRHELKPNKRPSKKKIFKDLTKSHTDTKKNNDSFQDADFAELLAY